MTQSLNDQLTEAFIAERLQMAVEEAGHSSAGNAGMANTEQKQIRCAAVLIPLLRDRSGWHILYTRRTNYVESHKGQVSFPGGGCDEGETTPEQTALREAEEEIGINPKTVHILGQLASLVTITSYRVTPVVGVIGWPATFQIGEHEVERVFTIPLEWLADHRNRWDLPFPGRKNTVIAYHPYDGELLWGITAQITVDFLHALDL
jgi:8-oxo-dGTP pyrophosphatase MutT (NUDIX family)